MSASVNKAIIMGNLGRDPEIRKTGDGRSVANLNLATSERWKDRDGNQQERTEWHRVVIFGGLADVAEKYLSKGDSVYLEGKIQTRKWQDNNGQDRYTTEVVVDQGGTMQMLGKRGGSGGSQQDAPPPAGPEDYGQAAAGNAKPTAISSDAPFDDDVPF